MPRISAQTMDGIRAHAELAYPQECCGVLCGHATDEGWVVTQALPAGNASAAVAGHRYSIAPEELVLLKGRARRQGLEIAGFYHSHPDQPAQWSQTDLAEAQWPDCCTLIVAVEQGRAGAVRAFLLREAAGIEKKFQEEDLRVFEQACEPF